MSRAAQSELTNLKQHVPPTRLDLLRPLPEQPAPSQHQLPCELSLHQRVPPARDQSPQRTCALEPRALSVCLRRRACSQ
eukprot:2894130-Rhodomonas_salina.2